MSETILSIRDLCVDYITDDGPVRAVDRVSLNVEKGEVLGIAGESGCGKSTIAKAVMRILPVPAVISGGEMSFEGRDILAMDESDLRALRWNRISMVFQSAMDALNPVLTIGEQIEDTITAHVGSNTGAKALNPALTVGEQISDTITAHAGSDTGAVRNRAQQLLEMVGIPGNRVDNYAHELSGGMRQRVGIAMALALQPRLVILDEPTTALDVIVERDILRQIASLQREFGFSVLFITHDLSRMLQVSDRVAIFYAARLVEVASADALRHAPKHPYTQGLLRAFPSLHPGKEEPVSIPGSPPSLASPPQGCRFHPRCPLAVDACREREPELRELGPGRVAACHLAE
jgi:peptide/nickel transport system ATP-binding protein